MTVDEQPGPMSGGTEPGESAAALDAAVGLTRGHDDGEWAVLHLRPEPVAIGSSDPITYLHGGVLATCVDTAAWEAVVKETGGSWVVADMRLDFVRLARVEDHVVRARVRKLGRRQAVADVEIAAAADPDRLVALGRATLTRTD